MVESPSTEPTDRFGGLFRLALARNLQPTSRPLFLFLVRATGLLSRFAAVTRQAELMSRATNRRGCEGMNLSSNFSLGADVNLASEVSSAWEIQGRA
jgi:hypothetical protein